MIVEIDIDDEIHRLIEYIPVELLPDILSALLKEAMTASVGVRKVQDEQSRQSSSDDIRELIETVKQVLSGAQVSATAVEPKKIINNIVKAKAKVVSADLGVTDVDDFDNLFR